jgi:hypothetical protein
MNFFREFGDAIDTRWRACGYDEAVFVEIASEALTRTPPSRYVSPDQIVDWVLASTNLCYQPNLALTFGNPPITVYAAPRFYVEALFWVDGTTSVHQHSFSGAFHTLDGSSLHARYSFKQRGRFSGNLLYGDTRLESVELLTKGDTRPIPSGSALIHALFHLDRPSVSIVVRTFKDPNVLPQYEYVRPTLGHDPFYEDPLLKRQVQCARLLFEIGRPDADERVARLLESADPLSAYRVLADLLGLVPKERFDTLLEGLRVRQPILVEQMIPAFAEMRRQLAIVSRRRKVHDGDHRFFLAVLMNVSSRTRVLDLVRARHPCEDPVDVAVRWVRELATTRLEGESENILGLPLDDVSLDVLEHAIRGRSLDDTLRRLEEDYDAADVRSQAEEIGSLYGAVRRLGIFLPLFVD